MSAEIDPLSTLEKCATAAAELLVSAAAARVLPIASVDLSVLIAFSLFSAATLIAASQLQTIRLEKICNTSSYLHKKHYTTKGPNLRGEREREREGTITRCLPPEAALAATAE
jgi:hypothetical protein